MEGTLDAEDARSRKFEIVRRGYDRRQVDRFRDEAAVSIAALTTELAQLREKMAQAGMEEVTDLKSELDAVSGQVADILESARAAAEGMRSRASEDAARWRADADRETRELRSASTRDAEDARRAAWEDGTELLKQADAEAKRLVDEARQEALFIRAEAEREALRLTGDARRDKEEAMRQVRTETERLLMDARAESGRILDKARRSAQSAQERAQALEQRRAELMHELEAARNSIGQLEAEIDTRREALQAAAEAPDSGVRVIKSGNEGAAEWVDDDASVRIVPASSAPVEEPVDPDAFVAEVEQLQSELAAAGAALEAAEEAVEEAAEGEPAQEDRREPDGDGESDEVADAESAGPADASGALREPGGDGGADQALEPPAEPAGEPEPPASEPAIESPGPPDGLDDLFARLRDGDADDEPEPEPVPETAEPSDAAATAGEESEAAGSVATLQAAEPAALARAVDVAADPFELRDRVLLPIENRTLRSVKRRVVDLQNRVLEELRVTDADWEPDRSMFTAAVADDIARLIQESFIGGHAAAAELLGVGAAPPPDRPAGQEAGAEFVDGLVAAVAEALERSRASGGGRRQVSAAVGRVFRAWRTDEAARRLRRAGYLSYNQGLLGAYPGLGVDSVVAVSPGTPCGKCPAGTDEAWEPGRPTPAGTSLPPATQNCAATILPAG